MAVDADRAAFDGQRVLSVQPSPSGPLDVVTGVAYRFAVPRAAVRRRGTLSLLAGPVLRTAVRFRFGQLVVAFDATSLVSVALTL